MSHFPTTPRSALYCGTPYEQFQTQYWQPMQVSALCRTTPVFGSFVYASTGHPIIRSAEPAENWSWCYADELMFRLRAS